MSTDPQVKIDNPELWEMFFYHGNIFSGYKVEICRTVKDVFDNKIELVDLWNRMKVYHLAIPSKTNKFLLSSDEVIFEPATEWFEIMLKFALYDHNLKTLKLINLDLNGLTSKRNNYLGLLLDIQKQNRLEIINCINYEILENQQLKQELELKTNQTKLKSNVFIFEKEIPQEYRTAFGEYFMGIKDFIYLAKGKNLGISIDINGYLKITIHSELQEDIDLVEKAFIDFTRNIEPILKNQTPTLITPVDDLLRANKAIIILTNKIKTLETSIMTANLLSSNTLLDESETIKRLTQINSKLENKLFRLQSDYGTLQDQNMELLTRLSEVKSLLLDSKTNSLSSDTSDAIVGLISQIKIAVDSQESSLLKRSINSLDDFVKLNESKIKLIPIPKILDILKAFVQDIRRR